MVVEQIVQALAPYALWIVLALVLLAGYAVVRGWMSGEGNLGVAWFGVLLVLGAIYLWISGDGAVAFLVVLGAILVFAVDGFHERRLTRREHARHRE
jgi:hypothetical protein